MRKHAALHGHVELSPEGVERVENADGRVEIVGGRSDADHRVAHAESQAVQRRGGDGGDVVGGVIGLEPRTKSARQTNGGSKARDHADLLGGGDQILDALGHSGRHGFLGEREVVAATEDIAKSQRTQLDITQRRVTAGGASRIDVLQQLATLQRTLANLPVLRSQLAQERNLLATYVGALPADYGGAEINLDHLTLPTDLPVSLPSKLVEQRPDVRQYSELLHQATAQIGVATANMLPQLTLTGSYGGVAETFSDVFNPSSVIWSLVGGVTQPIFKGGELVHQRRAAIAAAQEAAANYKATVITAFSNVSNTLYALQADADALAAETLFERTAAESLTLVQAQYKSGAASYLQVLTAEQSYQSAAVGLVKARAQRYADTAALFQALGGGWWNRNDLAANSSDKGPL